jgi:hypothetical protein
MRPPLASAHDGDLTFPGDLEMKLSEIDQLPPFPRDWPDL